jgi:hypothetical protein
MSIMSLLLLFIQRLHLKGPCNQLPQISTSLQMLQSLLKAVLLALPILIAYYLERAQHSWAFIDKHPMLMVDL